MNLVNTINRLRIEFRRFVVALLFFVLIIIIVIKSGNFNIRKLLGKSTKEIERNVKRMIRHGYP